jgi:hypothetical protein
VIRKQRHCLDAGNSRTMLRHAMNAFAQRSCPAESKR